MRMQTNKEKLEFILKYTKLGLRQLSKELHVDISELQRIRDNEYGFFSAKMAQILNKKFGFNIYWVLGQTYGKTEETDTVAVFDFCSKGFLSGAKLKKNKKN